MAYSLCSKTLIFIFKYEYTLYLYLAKLVMFRFKPRPCLVPSKVGSLGWNWYDMTKSCVYDRLMLWKKLEVWIYTQPHKCFFLRREHSFATVLALTGRHAGWRYHHKDILAITSHRRVGGDRPADNGRNAIPNIPPNPLWWASTVDVDALRFRSPGQRSHASYGARPRRRDGLCRVSSSPTQSRPPVRRARLARFRRTARLGVGRQPHADPRRRPERPLRFSKVQSHIVSSCVCVRARAHAAYHRHHRPLKFVDARGEKKKRAQKTSLSGLSLDRWAVAPTTLGGRDSK
jgi:hypothetical protein